MNERTRLGAAVLGGYVLGRTKKGTTAIRMAIWLNGTSRGALVRDRLRRFGDSSQMNKLVSQAGQPLVEAARGAAVAAVEARLSGIAEGLNRRTEKLLPAVGGGKDAEQNKPDRPAAEADDITDQDGSADTSDPAAEETEREDSAPEESSHAKTPESRQAREREKTAS